MQEESSFLLHQYPRPLSQLTLSPSSIVAPVPAHSESRLRVYPFIYVKYNILYFYATIKISFDGNVKAEKRKQGI